MNATFAMIRTRTARRGFTFLEIMLVVMIIGLLAAVVGPRIVGQGQKARMRTTAIAIKSMGTALKQYELDLGTFPSTSDGLAALITRPNGVDDKMWAGPYIEEDSVPKDAWNHPYGYRYPPQEGQFFDLYSIGPDGQEGTEDDITNWTKDK
jgi:general secretion pathway protein G